MNVYIYQGALICWECEPKVQTASIYRGLDKPGGWATFVRDWERMDSDHFPQGPYGDGGGEADFPQHCDCCDKFLANPLTDAGYDYIVETRAEWLARGKAIEGSFLEEWIAYYD